MLLLFMQEEKAFWVLCCIVEDKLQEYYSESMVGNLVDQKVFEELLETKVNKVHSHLSYYSQLGFLK